MYKRQPYNPPVTVEQPKKEAPKPAFSYQPPPQAQPQAPPPQQHQAAPPPHTPQQQQAPPQAAAPPPQQAAAPVPAQRAPPPYDAQPVISTLQTLIAKCGAFNLPPMDKRKLDDADKRLNGLYGKLGAGEVTAPVFNELSQLTSGARHAPPPVSYTHLTLPTIYPV